jgi:2-hydroxy-3-oxopropionate reductase
MVGGTQGAIDAVSEPMKAYAKRIMRVGGVGAGQTAKLCNQNIVGATLLAIAESVQLARRNGIDPARLPELLAGGWADSTLLRIYAPRMSTPPADNIGAINTLLKDVEAVARVGETDGAVMPLNAAVQQTLRLAVKWGLGELDISRIVQLLDGSAVSPSGGDGS